MKQRSSVLPSLVRSIQHLVAPVKTELIMKWLIEILSWQNETSDLPFYCINIRHLT